MVNHKWFLNLSRLIIATYRNLFVHFLRRSTSCDVSCRQMTSSLTHRRHSDWLGPAMGGASRFAAETKHIMESSFGDAFVSAHKLRSAFVCPDAKQSSVTTIIYPICRSLQHNDDPTTPIIQRSTLGPTLQPNTRAKLT